MSKLYDDLTNIEKTARRVMDQPGCDYGATVALRLIADLARALRDETDLTTTTLRWRIVNPHPQP